MNCIHNCLYKCWALCISLLWQWIIPEEFVLTLSNNAIGAITMTLRFWVSMSGLSFYPLAVTQGRKYSFLLADFVLIVHKKPTGIILFKNPCSFTSSKTLALTLNMLLQPKSKLFSCSLAPKDFVSNWWWDGNRTGQHYMLIQENCDLRPDLIMAMENFHSIVEGVSTIS